MSGTFLKLLFAAIPADKLAEFATLQTMIEQKMVDVSAVSCEPTEAAAQSLIAKIGQFNQSSRQYYIVILMSQNVSAGMIMDKTKNELSLCSKEDAVCPFVDKLVEAFGQSSYNKIPASPLRSALCIIVRGLSSLDTIKELAARYGIPAEELTQFTTSLRNVVGSAFAKVKSVAKVASKLVM